MVDDLERRAIVAVHDAECHCGDAPSTSFLTERERHIVALWRADMAEKSAEIDEKSRIGHAISDAWMDKANETNRD